MSDQQDVMDRLLRGYAQRWREAQPPPPTVDIARLLAARPARAESTRPRWVPWSGPATSWLPVAAAAVAVALLAAGLAFVRGTAPPPRPPTTSPTTPPGVVPWAPLPPSGVALPTRTVPASPDPAEAESLPPCRADWLRVEPKLGVAAGTRYLTLTFRVTDGTRCRLAGRPDVTALDGETALAVPIDTSGDSSDYTGPVAVSGDRPATLALSWSSGWCASPVVIDRLRLSLPENGGTLTTDGFGPSQCYGQPGSGERSPIRVGTFRPADFAEARQVTVFDGVSATVAGPDRGTAGGRLRFTVTLTAPGDRDVPLDRCPDYTVLVEVGPDKTEASYALNCAAVPYRDGAGRPFLPAGVGVQFDMRAEVPPGVSGSAKLVWQLDLPSADSVVAGGVLTIG